MGSLDVDSFFTNIPLEETINICTELIYGQNDSTEGLNKSECKELLTLANKESYFIFYNILYKQIDSVAMSSPLGPTLANALLCFYEKSGQNNVLINLNQFIIEDMQMTFLYYLSQAIKILNLGIT